MSSVTAYHGLDPRQVSNLNYERIQRLTFASSAPGESQPLLQRNTRGIVDDIRHDIVKVGATISEVHRDIVNVHTMVDNVLKSHERADSQDPSVSVTYTLPITE